MAVLSRREIAAQRKTRLAEERRATFTFIAIISIACLIFGVWLTYYTPETDEAILIDNEGRPKPIRNLYMAGSLCQEQANMNYHGSLVQAIIDDFSSRYDQPRDLFVISLMVSVRYSSMRNDEYQVHCHVIPENTVVDYFKGFMVTP